VDYESNVQLGDYVIEERIGSGGMGEVFRARQQSLDRVVALKILPRSVAEDATAKERFFREARSAASLVHPNVVQIYTVGEERGIPFFAMEYIEGRDLGNRLKTGERFTLGEVVDIMASVAMALEFAEEHGIVHRDIKPANIMIDKSRTVKVMDFGLAKATTSITQITQAGFIVGTPTYMSPEQAEGGEVDIRSDIYSLGIVFYLLLTGRPPFSADSPAAVIYQHLHARPVSPSKLNPEIPEAAEEITLCMIAKRPADRYQSASELLDDLLALREEVGASGDGSSISLRHAEVDSETLRLRSPTTSTVTTGLRITPRSEACAQSSSRGSCRSASSSICSGRSQSRPSEINSARVQCRRS